MQFAVLLLAVMLWPASAQEVPEDVLGVVRGDGVVLPLFAWTDSSWAPTAGPTGNPAWGAIRRYKYVEADGASQWTTATDPVRLGSGWVNGGWGHATRLVEGDGPDPSHWPALPIVGYAVSVEKGDDPLVPIDADELVSPTTRLLLELHPVDSAGPVGVRAWRAIEADQSPIFFQATRTDGHVGCYIAVGWLNESEPRRLHVISSGSDDCAGKGHGDRTPRALLLREGRQFALVSKYSYSDTGVQLWAWDDGGWKVAYELFEDCCIP